MQPIRSGSTTERIIRTTLVTFLAVGASGWCFYDAYVGYPMENLRRTVKTLSPEPEPAPDLITPAVNKHVLADIQELPRLEDVKNVLGEPGWVGEQIVPKKRGSIVEDRKVREAWFFGPAGHVVAVLGPADTIKKIKYEPAVFKREMDLLFQKVLGTVIGLLAVVLVVHWLRVVLGRTTVTEEGIKVMGHPRVPYEAVTALHDEQYARKGWVELEYELDGRTRTLRLDDYKLRAFPRIIAEICQRKGFEDPYQKWQEQKKAVAS